MRAVTIQDGELVVEERPGPEPGKGELLVRVRAAGLNGADMLQRRGAYPAPPGSPPDIPGLELAGAELRLGEERVVRRGEHLRQAARGGPVERLRHGPRGALVHHRQLRVAASSHDRHHAVALGKALGARAKRLDLAGQLQARVVGGRARRRRVGASPLEHVRPVQARGAHANQQFALARLGVRALLHDQLPVLDGYLTHRRGIYPCLVKRV